MINGTEGPSSDEVIQVHGDDTALLSSMKKEWSWSSIDVDHEDKDENKGNATNITLSDNMKIISKLT